MSRKRPDDLTSETDEATGLRWFSGRRVTIDGITSVRPMDSGVQRQMISLFDDGDSQYGSAGARCRADLNTDLDLWIEKGVVVLLDPQGGRHYG